MTKSARSMLRLVAVAALAVLVASGAQARVLQGCGFRPSLVYSDASQAAAALTDAHLSPPRYEFRRACDYYTLATIYQFEGKYQAALIYYDKALGWDRTFGDVYEGRGDVYAVLGQTEMALKSYGQTRLTSMDDADGLYSLCWDRVIRGYTLDRALADCSAAVKEYPNAANYRQARCFVYYRMANYASAIADCTAALAQWHDMSGALYVRGVAELATGDAAAAKADIAAARRSYARVADVYALYGIKPPAPAE